MNETFLYRWLPSLTLTLLMIVPVQLFGQNQQPPVPPDSVHVVDTVNMKTQMILEELIEKLETRQSEKKGSLDLEIDGLIVDNSVTKVGRDFYDLFLSKWEAPPEAKNFTITIRELPARGISSVVIVEINDQRIIELPLQPRYDIIEEMAGYAAQNCYEYLLNYEQIQKELSGDDLSGSGIY